MRTSAPAWTSTGLVGATRGEDATGSSPGVVLTEEGNYQGLARLNAALIQQAGVVRADAAFALPSTRRWSTGGVRFANDLLTRPHGRPSYVPLVRYRSFQYQAASWNRPRRAIAKVEPVTGSGPMRPACCSGSSPTTSRSATTPCRWPSRAGRCRVSGSGSSRPVAASFGMPDTSSCSLPKAA